MAWVETLTDPKNLVAAAVAMLSFGTIVTLAAPVLKGDKLEAA